MSQPLDDVDRRIVAILSRDARISVRALAAEVHVSRANAYARMRRLIDDGVIRGFHADVDPVALGLGTSAYVTLNLRQTDWPTLRTKLADVPGVTHTAVVGGNFDVIMLVRARDNADLRRIVLGEIQGIDGVLSTQTSLVFDEMTRPVEQQPPV